MTGIYGNFTEDDENIFLKRSKSLQGISEHIKNDIFKRYPNLSGHIKVSYPNIDIVIGRYLNDRKRLKALHNTYPIHRSKIISHIIKWIRLNPILVSALDITDYRSLTSEETRIIYNLNIFVINSIINYFFEIESIEDDKEKDFYKDILNDLIYHIKTDSYDEHLASIILKSLSRK